jgi:hypothetical protein
LKSFSYIINFVTTEAVQSITVRTSYLFPYQFVKFRLLIAIAGLAQ